MPLYVAIDIAVDPQNGILSSLRSSHTWAQPDTYLILFFGILGLELAFALLALMLLPWSDPRASHRATSFHALRTVWLHTGHLALAAFPLAVVIAWLSVLQFSAGWQFFQQYLFPAAFGGGVIWSLWGTTRAVSSPLDPPEPREPLCEYCGYNLSYHQDADARCPECGRPAQWSFSKDRRQPLRWLANSTRPGRRLRWLQITLDAWFQPARVFTDLSTQTGLGAAGLFLCTQLFFTGEAMSLALLIGVTIISPGVGPPDTLEFFYFTNLLGGFWCLVVGAFICLVAAIVGLLISRQIGRNCIGGVIRVACYCSGIFAPWLFLQIITVFATIEILESLHIRLWPVFMGFIGLIVLLAAIYVGGVVRRIDHVRYANR